MLPLLLDCILLYADDIVLLAETEEEMQSLLFIVDCWTAQTMETCTHAYYIKNSLAHSSISGPISMNSWIIVLLQGV